ncbi:MAG: translation initiation factor IF-2, partial [Acidimicrobiia bacterium]|nr:translation initiation factor IF-2 [Acidimicrobiia bacterium]
SVPQAPAASVPQAPAASVPQAPAASAPADAPAPPMSATGNPIPPPPGPPTSQSGKPIPPPPGLGGRGPAPAPRGRPGGPGVARPGGPRPGGAPAGGGPRQSVPGAGPGGGGGPGGRPGGPGGGRPGGGPGQNRRPPRRKGRRRRSREELQPMDFPSYTPDDTAVPEGVVVLERASTPQDLGPKLNRTAADVVRFLMQQGEMVTATQSLNDDMIELFAADVGAEIRLVDPGEEQEVELLKMLEVGLLDDDEDDDDAPLRPPVITVMGHVDHGKTTLLDRIRSANVVAGEAGGITQHIGAYQTVRNDRLLTFIDTPGHEAFTAMRARGADATDIVILVVAADDGVMPQTIEALDHARAADVPIVVAVNKIDRDNADPTRVLQQLSERGLVPEAWGGDTIVVEVSALQDLGIDDLLDNLLVVADLEDLRAAPDGRSRGVVLESHLDVGRGPVATVLVQRGTLKVGDPLVAGASWGRVRALIDYQGNQVKEAGPSTPVEVLGLSDVAQAGDDFIVAPDERKASKVAETREHWQRVASHGRDAHAMSGGARLEDIFSQIQAGEAANLNLVVKADVNGSLEALTESLKKLERPEVKLSFVLRGVGGISQGDIELAAASNATIIGFNVRPDRNARELALAEGVEIRSYEIIYKALEDIENAIIGMLAPEYEEVVTGDAEVREIFRVPRIGAIAGCYVTNGVITRGSKVRFLREGTIIWKGDITSLKRFKDDAREVAAGYECGIGLSDFQDLKPGDIIETFEEREIPRT